MSEPSLAEVRLSEGFCPREGHPALEANKEYAGRPQPEGAKIYCPECALSWELSPPDAPFGPYLVARKDVLNVPSLRVYMATNTVTASVLRASRQEEDQILQYAVASVQLQLAEEMTRPLQ